MPWSLLAKQTDIGQSKSSVLNPLQWILVILLLGLGLLFVVHASTWIISGIAVCAFANVVLLYAAYVFFAFKNPDALRSEGFSLQKLAIEKGVVGDSLQGMKTIDATSGLILPTQDTKDHQEQQG